MRICLIGKYPPIEGGVSSEIYWLAKGLGEKGHEVHVVTNAWEVEKKYREKIRGNDLDRNYQPKNVHVHNTDPFVDPVHIPYSKLYTEKIASLAIDVIRRFDLQLIDSWYLAPYGVSGSLAKTITDRPQIVRHAGSDMSRLLNSPYLRSLLISLFRKAERIVTYPVMERIFEFFGVPEERIASHFKMSVDTAAFRPEVKPIELSEYMEEKIRGRPLITYIGKLNIAKGVYELVEAASKIKEDFLLLFVTQNTGLEGFKEFIEEKRMMEKSLFLGFVPPWRIPSIITRSLCVVVPERDFPVTHHTPIVPREVLAAGGCLILSREVYHKNQWLGFSDKENLLVVDPKDISEFQVVLEIVLREEEYVKKLKQKARQLAERIEEFDQYIDATIQFYEEVAVP